MKIAVAGDSAGEGLAKILTEYLSMTHDVSDVSRTVAGVDAFYANLSDRVASDVIEGKYDRAILVCGTGIGVCLAANKVPGIRAAQCHDTYSAGKAATSNNAQIITLGARVVGVELAKAITDAYLNSSFDTKGSSVENVAEIGKVDAKYHKNQSSQS